jgi:hypothetical protein
MARKMSVDLPIPHHGDEYSCTERPLDTWHVHVRLASHANPGAIVAIEYVGVVMRLMKPSTVHVGYRDRRLKRFFLPGSTFNNRLSSAIRDAVDKAARLNGLPLTGTEEEVQADLKRQVEIVLAEPRPTRPNPTR